MQSVLVLNADHQMLNVVPGRKAICMILADKARMVSRYPGREVRSVSRSMPHPAVIMFREYVNQRRRLKLSRKNVFARDCYTCQYCGLRPRRRSGLPRLSELTLDHVVPRAQAENNRVWLPWTKAEVRLTSWENLLTACRSCNFTKANRTPIQAGMTMAKRPRPPTPTELAWMSLFSYEIPQEWKEHLREGSPWRGYWDVELIS